MAQAIRLHQVSPLKASCHQCSLSNLCLPLAIEENDLDRLEDIVQQGKIYNRGEHIFDQSTPVRSCFAVKSGSIKTSIIWFSFNHKKIQKLLSFYLFHFI